jgi:hypothetical protein
MDVVMVSREEWVVEEDPLYPLASSVRRWQVYHKGHFKRDDPYQEWYIWL